MSHSLFLSVILRSGGFHPWPGRFAPEQKRDRARHFSRPYRLPLRLVVALSWLSGLAFAQEPKEFPRGWVLPVELGQGLRSGAGFREEVYLASLQAMPMYTVVAGKLRVGGNAGGFYTGRKLGGLAGPRLAYNVYDRGEVLASSLYNVQVFGEYGWATDGQRLLGGGVALEVGQTAVFSLRAHRDYARSEWWFQTSLAIHLLRKKRSDDPFDP